MTPIEIRDAGPEQAPEILAIERRCFSSPWGPELLRHILADETQRLLAALDGSGRLLGYAGALFVLDEGYISNVAVLPEARRRHVADALLEALEARAAEAGLAFLTLEVRQSNAPAIALYEKHGYLTVGRRKNYYEKPAEDAMLMTKAFAQERDRIC